MAFRERCHSTPFHSQTQFLSRCLKVYELPFWPPTIQTSQQTRWTREWWSQPWSHTHTHMHTHFYTTFCLWNGFIQIYIIEPQIYSLLYFSEKIRILYTALRLVFVLIHLCPLLLTCVLHSKFSSCVWVREKRGTDRQTDSFPVSQVWSHFVQSKYRMPKRTTSKEVGSNIPKMFVAIFSLLSSSFLIKRHNI